ncbi:DVU0298 family protein [Gemmatimonadota bacterium]
MAFKPLKKTVRDLLEQGEIDRVAEMAVSKRRVLGSLVSLSFDSDPEIAWRAIEASGASARLIVRKDPNTINEHLRRILWLVTEESGGICWHAPELMAEILAQLPGQFTDYVPIAASFLVTLEEEDLEHFRPGALWAIGRLGELAREQHSELVPAVAAALENPDPQARGMAVWCLGQIERPDLLSDRPELLTDDGPVDLYQERTLSRTTVGELAERAGGA